MGVGGRVQAGGALSLESITHTARRDHLCAFCGLTVRTGEQYVRAQSPGGAQAKKAFHSACYIGLVASAGRK